MSIQKALDFNNGYGNYSGDVKPTTQADMYRFMENQNNVLMALADAVLWQPSTAYKVGDVVRAPSMNGYHARCTVAGTSGSDAPSWNFGGVTMDGTVTWTLEQQSAINEQQSAINEQQSAINEQQSAINEQQSAINEQQSAINEQQSAAITNAANTAAEIADYTHQLKRSTAYSVGDIAYSASLPSYLYLECTTAGTTGTSEPDWDTAKMGGVNSDGTAKFTLRDIRNHHNVGDIVIKDTTPKDCEYLLPMDGQSFDTTVYVLLAELYPSGKLPCLNDNRFLEGASTAGNSKDAGLPNIKGALRSFSVLNYYKEIEGAFYNPDKASGAWGGNTNNVTEYRTRLSFDASKSNSIYGNSDTVQPKSYTVKYYVCYA